MPAQFSQKTNISETFQDNQTPSPRFSDWNKLSEHRKILLLVVIALTIVILALAVGLFFYLDRYHPRASPRTASTNTSDSPRDEEEGRAVIFRTRRPRKGRHARRHYVLSRHLHRQRLSGQIVEPPPYGA